jgi:ribosomal protein S18 acetylase RimI-like enzyme
LSLTAWPALTSRAYDGWLLRFASGRSRRANSVNPVRRGALPLIEKIPVCEQAFRAEGLPPVFRIPSITPEHGLDDALAARGYRKGGKTSIRLCDLAGLAESGGATLTDMPTGAWLDTFARFDGMSAAECAAHRAIVAATPYDMAFGAVHDEGAITAVGAAVLQDRFVYLNSIATDVSRRRRGLGRNVVVSLLAWAKQRGAAFAYLPVDKSNVAGLALYNSLGFRTELYRYHYRALD